MLYVIVSVLGLFIDFSYSILPGLCVDGILHHAIQPMPYKIPTFNNFISDLMESMNPFPRPNSIIMMDNVPIHKSVELHKMVEAW
ncbi:hypothetical protein BDV93DRAFT_455653 [Ceratobasidium sp. AG-I]|nr:hypothetical protein BDV93DRAFT_455653 [Ceratobasidium sp. AG-I]